MDVWLDQGEIGVGDSISGQIEQGLEECDFLVVLCSRASIESGWVAREVHSRIDLEVTTGRTVILPVRVEKCEMPPLLADKLYADLADDYDAAVAAVVQAVSQPGEQSGSAGAAAGFATHAGESVADVAIDGRLRASP